MGAPPGPVGWFVLAQALDAAGEPVGKAFGLAKARSLDHANIVADHAQGLAGTAFNRIGARMLLAHHRIGTFDAATMSLDERCNAEQSIEKGLTRQSRRELHRCAEGETVKAFEVKADSARSAMIHRLTRLARGLAEEDDVRAGGGGGAPVANALSHADAPMTADHELILAVLGKNPAKCFLVNDVTSVCTIRDRETVGRLLRELDEIGMVHRPYGPRKGYSLTLSGKAWTTKQRKRDDTTPALMPT